jgi:uncharacterized protein (DUF983 family)
MAVTRPDILWRGLTMRCPNCGGRTLVHRWLRVPDECTRCGLRFEREEGFFLGAVVINYTVTGVVLLAPLLVAVFRGQIEVVPAMALGVVWCLVFPVLFYPYSKSLWLLTYYVFFPNHLPANQHRAQE